MKLSFNRPKDWLDVERLVASRADFDRTYVAKAIDDLFGPEDGRRQKWDALTTLL